MKKEVKTQIAEEEKKEVKKKEKDKRKAQREKADQELKRKADKANSEQVKKQAKALAPVRSRVDKALTDMRLMVSVNIHFLPAPVQTQAKHAVRALEQSLSAIDQKMSSGSTESPGNIIKHAQKLVEESTKFKHCCNASLNKLQDATSAFSF